MEKHSYSFVMTLINDNFFNNLVYSPLNGPTLFHVCPLLVLFRIHSVNHVICSITLKQIMFLAHLDAFGPSFGSELRWATFFLRPTPGFEWQLSHFTNTNTFGAHRDLFDHKL